MNDDDRYSLYLIRHARASGDLDIEARILPDDDIPPGDLSHIGELPETGIPLICRFMSGAPASLCEAIGRGYVAYMRSVLEHGPLPAMPVDLANLILRSLETKTRKQMERLVRELGCSNLDLVVGAAVKATGFHMLNEEDFSHE